MKCVACFFTLGSTFLLAAEIASASDNSANDNGTVHGLSIAGMIFFVFGSLCMFNDRIK